jgi:hypothetical protein
MLNESVGRGSRELQGLRFIEHGTGLDGAQAEGE